MDPLTTLTFADVTARLARLEKVQRQCREASARYYWKKRQEEADSLGITLEEYKERMRHGRGKAKVRAKDPRPVAEAEV